MKNFRIFLFVILGICLAYSAKSFFLSEVKAQTLNSDTSDAIAVRIMPNPNHYSITRWYGSQGFSGAPQALTVDGYEAVRDGRTVYVNATNVDGKNIYTNVYLISYNQSSAAKTIDILGQIVNHWKFNNNITESSNPLPNCAISNKSCAINSDCGENQLCSNSGISSSSCILKTIKNCSVDSDCPASFFCNSLKSKIIRDAKRVGQLEELKEALYAYKNNVVNNHYPILNSGTYLPNYSVSLWPSWSQNLLANMSVSSSFLDPINRLGACAGYDTKTCWNNDSNKFVFSPTQNALMLPAGSYAFVYKSEANGSAYNLCATIESSDPSLNYHFSPNNPAGSACLIEANSTGGGTATNTAPILVSAALTAEAGQEFNGFINVSDKENNPLTWTLYTNGTIWKNWQNNGASNIAPTLTDTNNINQKKIYASLAGDVGNYNIGIKIDDGKGGVLSTSTVIKIINSVPLIEAVDGEYLLSSYIPFTYSFIFSDANLTNASSSFSVSKLSGIFDIWAEANTETIESVGVNKYKVTHSGFLSSSTHQFASDMDFTYRVTVTDRYKSSSAKDFKIKLVVEKPQISFNCPAKARLEQSYSCLLGLAYSTTRKTLKYLAVGPLPDYLELIKNADSNYLISGRPANRTGLFKNEIQLSDEYSAFSTSTFSIKINNYCGDGKKQLPNDEAQSGRYNNGFEECDGLDGVTSNVASSTIGLQYACTTKSGYTIPETITSNDYCVFSSPLEGGGFCGDGYCTATDFYGDPLESTCNCEKDCGAPATSCSGTSNSCSYIYSDWSICNSSNTKSRTVLTTTPSACSGTPNITDTCVYSPILCNSWTYSAWDLCSGQGTQTRTISSSLPNGCSAGSPIISQACTPPPGACTYTYSDWGVCQSNNTQTRTVSASSPSGCTGKPETSQSCVSSCVYTYSDWGVCQSDNTQSRMVLTVSSSKCEGTPIIIQSCNYIPEYCIDNYECGSGYCSNLIANCERNDINYTYASSCGYSDRVSCESFANCNWVVTAAGICQ